MASDWITYSFPKGKKKSRPIRPCLGWKKSNTETGIEVICGENMVYVFDQPKEQFDFFKVLGESFHFGDNHKNSYMLACRYSPQRMRFEWTTYFHFDGVVYIGPDRVEIGKALLASAAYDVDARDAVLDVLSTIVPIYSTRIGQPIYVTKIRMFLGSVVDAGFALSLDGTEWETDTLLFPAKKFFWKIRPWFGGTLPAPRPLSLAVKNW